MAEEAKQEAQAPDPMAALNEKLKSLGVTAAMVMPVVQPLILEAVKATLAEMKLPQIVEGAVESKVNDKVGAFIKELQARAGFGGAPGGNSGAPAKAGLGQGIGIQDLISIGNMLGIGKKEDNSLAQMAAFAQAMGGVMKNMLEPVMDIYNMGQRNALQQIATVQRNPDAIDKLTGGQK